MKKILFVASEGVPFIKTGGLVDYIRIDEKSSTVVFRGGIEITI